MSDGHNIGLSSTIASHAICYRFLDCVVKM